MRKKQNQRIVISTLFFALTVCSVGGIFTQATPILASDRFQLVYNADDFTHSYQDDYQDNTDKAGLVLQSKKSGVTAEGIEFSFENEFSGIFEMDFGVASAKDYAYPSFGNGNTHYIGDKDGLSPSSMFSDEMNPYLDLKEVAFTFTSATNPESYFTVYVRGASGYMASMCSAYVYVPGDSTNAMKDENGTFVQGYGYNYKWTKKDGIWVQNGNPHYNAQGSGDKRSDYSLSNDGITAILGTSFSNFLTTSASNPTRAKSVSNLIKFDPATMNVYMNVGKSNGSEYSATNTTADMLIRDVATNQYFSATNGGSVASLSSASFANGYTVSVSFTDVTANECIGNASLFEDAYLYASSFSDGAYERIPSMAIYSINRTQLSQEGSINVTARDKTVSRSQTDFIEYDSNDFLVTENTGSRSYSEKGLLLQAKKSGSDAEGISFSFKDKMYGDFSTSFRVTSKNTYPTPKRNLGSTHWIVSDTTKLQNFYNDMFNPYLDLREVAFTFTSLSNPTKQFTVYIEGATSGRAYSTCARVEVKGDTIGQVDMENNMRYGYGLSDSGIYSNVLSLTPLQSTSFCNWNLSNSGTAIATIANAIRFSPEEMCVYATSYDPSTSVTTEKLVRNLITNQGVSGNYTFGSIDKNDFACGYIVSVCFTDVTDNATYGELTTNGEYGFNGVQNIGSVKDDSYKELSVAYNRYPEMILYSLNGQELAYKEETNKLLDTAAPVVTAPITVAYVNETIDVTPQFYDSATGSNQASVNGNVYVSSDGINFTPIQAKNGKYTYTPNEYGTLYISYMGFTDSVGNITRTIKKITIQDHILPALAFHEDVMFQYDFTNQGKRPTISISDITISNRMNDVKTYETVIESITRPNGEKVSPLVTHLNYFEAGEYTIVYRVTDNFNNTSTITRTIVAGDFSAPVLQIHNNLQCMLGEKIDLSPISVRDYDKDAMVLVDVYKDEALVYSGTDFTPSSTGIYTIRYTAMDSSGNVTTQSTNLSVLAAGNIYTQQK